MDPESSSDEKQKDHKSTSTRKTLPTQRPSHRRSKSGIPYFRSQIESRKLREKNFLENDVEIELQSLHPDGKGDTEDIELIEGNVNINSSESSHSSCRAFLRGVSRIFTSSWLNFFLALLPFTVLLAIFKWSNIALFIMSTLSLIPLSNLLRYALLHSMKSTPQAISNIIGISTRNAIPLILGIFAVSLNQGRVVQATVIGNILIRLSLIYGFTYLPSITKQFIVFDRRTNGVAISIMFTSCGVLLVPALFTAVGSHYMSLISMLRLSRWSSIIMLLGFLLYVVFIMKTNSGFWNIANRQRIHLNPIGSFVLLCIVIALISLESYFIMNTIHDASTKWGLSITFISGILLPAAYNAVDTVKTLELSFKEKHNTNVFIVTQSVAEICLLISPFLILLSWIMANDIGLNFFPFEGVALVSFMIIFHVVTSNGKSNWLQGGLLIVLYLVLCVCLFFHPDH